jgi:hypothetical protein
MSIWSVALQRSIQSMYPLSLLSSLSGLQKCSLLAWLLWKMTSRKWTLSSSQVSVIPMTTPPSTVYTRSCSIHYCGSNGFPFTSCLSSLHIAVVKGNIAALEKLLAVDDIVVDSVDENRETPLFYGVRFATSSIEIKLRMMNLLFETGAYIDAANNDGKTVLMQAASYHLPTI